VRQERVSSPIRTGVPCGRQAGRKNKKAALPLSPAATPAASPSYLVCVIQENNQCDYSSRNNL
jgi:hypothetical protein